jgi:hypothetical protein
MVVVVVVVAAVAVGAGISSQKKMLDVSSEEPLSALSK